MNIVSEKSQNSSERLKLKYTSMCVEQNKQRIKTISFIYLVLNSFEENFEFFINILFCSI